MHSADHAYYDEQCLEILFLWETPNDYTLKGNLTLKSTKYDEGKSISYLIHVGIIFTTVIYWHKELILLGSLNSDAHRHEVHWDITGTILEWTDSIPD